MKKQCFKCNRTKELSDFYKHSMMADGHLGKCKDCTKADTKDNRKRNLDYYRKYDRQRGNRQTSQYHVSYRQRFPRKASARRKVAYHLSTGNLVKQPCEICGTRRAIHAHHDDYSKPLNVRWLCAVHHRQWHDENGEGKNP